MSTEPIGDTLRRLRTGAGLSLNQFAKRYGITAMTMGSYERGDRRPTVERAREILAHFGYNLIAVPRGQEPDQEPLDGAS